MKKYSILLLSFLLFVLLSVSLSFQVKWSSPIGEFNATPDGVILDWTNSYQSDVTISSNASYNLDIKIVDNETTDITGNYSQRSFYWGAGSKYTGVCFFGDSKYDIPLSFKNSTGFGDVEYNVSPETTFNFTLIHYANCPPGKYWGNIVIRNETNATEYLTINVTINIPITTDNELNITTGAGTFKGTIHANVSKYHSYYFNTSGIKTILNSTGVSISLTSKSEDLDFFLFDESGNLVERDITKGFTSEGLNYNYLPVGKMWEIRIYGNFTSGVDDYTGSIHFTTLNATNATNPAQQLDKIDFGGMNVNDNKTIDIILKNEGSLDLKTVTESKELYHLDFVNSNSVPKDFTFLVPSFASKIIASINWTGASSYNLTLFKPDGTFVNSSSNKRKNANATDAMQEEFLITNSITPGFWKVGVKNITNATYGDPYTVIFEFRVSDGDILNWIKSNYSIQEFDTIGLPNSTQSFHFNFSVLDNAFAGKYEGSLKYNGYYGSTLEIPLDVNITTPELLVNGSLQSSTVRITDNIGFNTTRQISVLINNTGNKDLVIDSNSSSEYLNYSSNYMEFTFDYPSTSIAPGNSDNLDINIDIDTTKTDNAAGIYRGWIYLNDSDSHPYSYFNLTIEVNLTNRLRVDLNNIISEDGNNWIENRSKAENVTVEARVYYLNESGTEIKQILNSSNLKAWLIEGNVTDYRVPTTNYLPLYNNSEGTVWKTPSGPYNPNITIPDNIPGGKYYVHLGVDFYPNNTHLIGDGTYHPLVINNTGLNLTAKTSKTMEINENGDTTYFNATVINYGPLTAKGTLELDNETCKYAEIDVYTKSSAVCGDFTAGNDYFSVDIDPDETCEYSWKITSTSHNISSNQDCYPHLVTSDPNFGNITDIKITVKNVDTTSTTTSSTTTTTGDAAPPSDDTTTTTTTITTTTLPYLSITSFPSSVTIEQGKSKTESVKVKNINETVNQRVELSILYLDSSWYHIPSSSVLIRVEETHTYTINFTIPQDAGVDDYDAKFNASSPYTEIYKPFTLSVTPGESMKAEIEANLTYYQNLLTELERELNETKAKGYNTSEVEDIFNSLKNKINDAVELKEADDYKGAYGLFDDIESLLNQTRTAMRQVSGVSDWWSWGKYVIIVSVGVVAAFLGYLFWPTPSYQPKKGLPPPGREVKDKFSQKFDDLKKRWKELRQKTETGSENEG